MKTSRTFLFAAALLVLVVGFALLLSHAGAKPNVPPHIVVLSMWYSNREQWVTFRTEPPGTAVILIDLVSGSYDENAQPETYGGSGDGSGDLFPVHSPGQTNCSLRFVALPRQGASMGGIPLSYTPGSYTVAYSPSESTHRVRVEVALQRKGFGDYVQRLRRCWKQKTFAMLGEPSHQEPIFVTTAPITNAVPIAR